VGLLGEDSIGRLRRGLGNSYCCRNRDSARIEAPGAGVTYRVLCGCGGVDRRSDIHRVARADCRRSDRRHAVCAPKRVPGRSLRELRLVARKVVAAPSRFASNNHPSH
jgi:hypothetical protein